MLHMIDYKVNPIRVYSYIPDVHRSGVGLADETGNIVQSYT